MMQEVLKENQERHRKMIEERIEFEKKQDKKELIITIIVTLFVITLVGIILFNMKDNGAFDKCIKEGHSNNYCARTI